MLCPLGAYGSRLNTLNKNDIDKIKLITRIRIKKY